MVLNTAYFRARARQILKEDLQTALLVTFFSGCLITLTSLLFTLLSNDLMKNMQEIVLNYEATLRSNLEAESMQNVFKMMEQLQANLAAITDYRWVMLFGSVVLAIVFTPVLKVGEAAYYLNRLRGEEPSALNGLFGRFRLFGKALGMYVLMVLKMLLWGLIALPVTVIVTLLGLNLTSFGYPLILAAQIPMFMAYLRYSMSPFYLADHPEYGPMQAIGCSKELMKDKKLGYLMLIVRFLFLYILVILLEYLLESLGLPMWLITVVTLCAELVLSTYMAASSAAFYEVLTNPREIAAMKNAMVHAMREAGMDEDAIRRMNWEEDDSDPEVEPEEEPEDAQDEAQDEAPKGNEPSDEPDAPEDPGNDQDILD